MTIPMGCKSEDSIAEMIPLCVPEIRGNEWKYIKDCLETNWVSSVGSYVDRFEEEMALFVGTKHAVATVNGTSALHTALLVSGVKPNDEVLVSTLSFIAPANAIRYAGAWPVFMDADPVYWQMDAEKVSEFLHRECRWHEGKLTNRKTGRRIKALLPVHILGHPANLDPLLELAQKFNLVVVEDASESLGTTYKDRCVGSFGHIACFSFNGNKLITTGGGGMITTDNEVWGNKAKYLTMQAKDDPVQSTHHEIGYNYRLPNLLAAMGCAQLEKVPEYIDGKRAIARRYTEELMGVSELTPMCEAPWAFSTYWLYTVLLGSEKTAVNVRSVVQAMSGRKIQTRLLWQALHLSHAHAEAQSYYCDTAERICGRAICLPSSVGISVADQKRVIEAFHEGIHINEI